MPRRPLRPEFLTLSGAAVYASCSPLTIERWINDGLLPVYRVGDRGHRRVRVSELEAILTNEGQSAS